MTSAHVLGCLSAGQYITAPFRYQYMQDIEFHGQRSFRSVLCRYFVFGCEGLLNGSLGRKEKSSYPRLCFAICGIPRISVSVSVGIKPGDFWTKVK